MTLTNLATIHSSARAHGVATALVSFAAPDPEALNPAELDFMNHNVKTMWSMQHLDFDAYREIVSTYNEGLRELCAERGIPYVPYAETLPDAGMLTFIDICHLTTDGMRVKARIIANAIEPLIADRVSR